ncbi:MAG: CpsD/CapB family tyrosine-protein kinase [Lactovum sp.]
MAKKNKVIINREGRLASILSSLNPKAPISEQYRTIRTSLEFVMVDRQFKTLMVTSAEAGAGKSTTISNLAISFSQQGKKVLFIDADLRKPVVHTNFQVDNRIGLTTVLSGQVDINDAIKTTSVAENLYLLTSGPIPPNPSELLGTATMRKLIQAVSKSFDVVLIDTPPVLAVADAQILAQITDGVFIVASSNQTRKNDLIKVKKSLEHVKANILGCVLHGLDIKESPYYYYYGVEE